MKAFKIENYEREHGPGTFVPFKHLALDDARKIELELQGHLKLPEGSLGKDILQSIHENASVVSGVNAENDQFDLRNVLDDLGLALSATTYLNWHRFDDIDEILSPDLLDHFNDIWYPATDDLELIDAQFQWIVVVHHSGTVKVLKLAMEFKRLEPGVEP